MSNPIVSNVIPRYSLATKNPLLYRMVVYFHEQENLQGQWRDQYKYHYDWYEKPRKRKGKVIAPVPNLKYYNKIVMDYMLGINFRKFPNTTLKSAMILSNVDKQVILNRWEYDVEIEQTFRRLLQFGDTDCMNLIKKYIVLAGKNYPTSYHICKTLCGYFDQYSSGELPEAQTPAATVFMVKATAYTKVLLDKIKSSEQ